MSSMEGRTALPFFCFLLKKGEESCILYRNNTRKEPLVMKEKIRTWVCARQEACQSSLLIRLLATAEGLSLLAAAVCYCLGFPGRNLSVLMIGSFLIWVGSVFFCLQNLKSRMILLAFEIAMFAFLIVTPVTDILTGSIMWSEYEPASALFAIISIGVSLFFLYVGGILVECMIPFQSAEPKNSCAPAGTDPHVFRMVSLCLYLFCMVFFLIQRVDILQFMQGKIYREYFLDYTPSYPGFVYTLATMMPFALCIHLSTFPKKLPAFLCLLLYVISALPNFLIGMRNPLTLALIFSFLYYALRDQRSDSQKWIGKAECRLTLAAIPVLLLLFSIMYTARNHQTGNQNLFLTLISAFSTFCCFDNLCMAHSYLPMMPDTLRWYTIGPIIDNVSRSRIGQLLFHTTPFPAGNNAVRALEGHNFGHMLSYLAIPEYFQGNGTGTYYIAETYCDFGWLGVILFSFLLGAFLIWFPRGMQKSWLVKSILLISLTNLLMVPRDNATAWLSFLFEVHFWFAVAACVLGSLIFQKLGIYTMLSGFQKRICQFFHRSKTE